MKLILVRHGETIENKEDIHQGQEVPGKLSEEGIEQAKRLASRLKDEKIDAIYSSDLGRAADTAKEIAKYHNKSPIYFVKELRERHTGQGGKKRDEIDWDNPPEDAETLEDVQIRVKGLLDGVYLKYPDRTVLFVGHNGVNLSLITVILNKPAKHVIELDKLPNTSVCIFKIKEDRNHKVILLRCTDHLK